MRAWAARAAGAKAAGPSGAAGPAGACKATFVVSREFHAANRKRVGEMGERGGTAVVDWKSVEAGGRVVVREDETVKGGYDYIDIPRALIDWHSHPGKCKSRDVCALGVPSPDDMRNVFIGAFSGSLGHLVYAKEGTFTIQVSPSLLSAKRPLMLADEKAFRKAADAVRDGFQRVYREYYDDRTVRYAEYRRRWVEEAARQGFKVRLFAGDARPWLRSAFECRYRTLDPSAQVVEPAFE